MKKEWIMSEEARREKKQRIQDNRERRMAERAQEDNLAQQKMTNQLDPTPTQVITNGIQMTPPSDPTIVQTIIGSTVGQQGIAPLAPLSANILPNLPLAAAPDISTIIPPVMPSIVSVPPAVQSIMQPNIVTQPEPSTNLAQAIQQVQIQQAQAQQK
jgi:hypothetical protein